MTALLDAAKTFARAAVADLDAPDDLIMPQFLWFGPYGIGHMPLFMMSSDEAKDQIAQAMTASLVVGRATEAVFISTVWMARVSRDDPTVDLQTATTTVQPSERPDRVEAIALIHHTQRGIRTAFAELARHDDSPPTLGDWQEQEEAHPKFRVARGRFGNAITLGLRFVTEMPPGMVALIDTGWRLGEQQDLIARFMKVQHHMLHPNQPPPQVAVVDPDTWPFARGEPKKKGNGKRG